MFRSDRQQLFIFLEFPGSNHDAETEFLKLFLVFVTSFPLKWLFAGLSLQRPGFHPSPAHVGFVLQKQTQ
jgi:hypothetical protein